MSLNHWQLALSAKLHRYFHNDIHDLTIALHQYHWFGRANLIPYRHFQPWHRLQCGYMLTPPPYHSNFGEGFLRQINLLIVLD